MMDLMNGDVHQPAEPTLVFPTSRETGCIGSDLKRHFEDHLVHLTMYFTASIAQTYLKSESPLVWKQKLSPLDAVAETDSD